MAKKKNTKRTKEELITSSKIEQRRIELLKQAIKNDYNSVGIKLSRRISNPDKTDDKQKTINDGEPSLMMVMGFEAKEVMKILLNYLESRHLITETNILDLNLKEDFNK